MSAAATDGRRLVAGLASPFPIGLNLPGLYQEDGLVQRFTAGLDDVLAPVLCTLDCFDAYLDPRLAPEDYTTWLASWVGVALDEEWSVARRREVVARAADLYAWRGTRYGIAEAVRTYTGVLPEVIDSGAVLTSSTPGAEHPGSHEASVRVVVGATSASRERLEAVLALVKPAHVVCHLEMGPP